MVFYRPNTDYVLPDLPNSTRCQDITESTPNNAYPAKYLDIDIVGAYDGLNNLQLQINGIGAGILPGSQDPLNNNKVVIKDPNGTTSFVFISDENVLSGGLSTNSFAASSVNSDILDNGSVITSKILNQAVTQNKLALLSVGNPQLIDDSITNEKIHDVNGSKIDDDSIENEKIHDVNGNKIDDRSIAAIKLVLQSITVQEIAVELYNLFVPIGTIIIFGGTTGLPDNWKECNGQAVSRVNYPVLFTNMGTRWGEGDGNTTFNLPDLRGRVPVGIGSDNSTNGLITNATAPSITLGATGIFGSQVHTLTINEMPSHNHFMSSTRQFNEGVAPRFEQGFYDNSNDGTTSNTGNDQPHNNTQPSVFVRYYVRAL